MAPVTRINQDWKYRSKSVAIRGSTLIKQLGNLHGVEGRAFEQLIPTHPKGESVLERAIKSYASNLAVILAGN